MENEQLGTIPEMPAKEKGINYWIVAGCLVVLAAAAYGISLYSSKGGAEVAVLPTTTPTVVGERGELPLVYTVSSVDSTPEVGDIINFKVYDPSLKQLVEDRKIQLQEFIRRNGVTSSVASNNPVYFSAKQKAIFYLNEPYQDCDGLGCGYGRLPIANRIMRHDLASKKDAPLFEEIQVTVKNSSGSYSPKSLANMVMTPDEQYLLVAEITYGERADRGGIVPETFNILKFTIATGAMEKLASLEVPDEQDQMMFRFTTNMVVSEDSQFAFLQRATQTGLEVIKINLATGSKTTTSVPNSDRAESDTWVSGNGKWIGFWDQAGQLSVYNLQTGKDVRFALDEQLKNVNLLWSTTGEQILFNGRYWIAAGSGKPKRLGVDPTAAPMIYDAVKQIALIANGSLPDQTRKLVLWDVAGDKLLDDEIGNLMPTEHEASIHGFGFIY